jgi:alkanesulfonate monooxygenase SsuD/methylene tetrahydromethanopterin reductase-like flavin-dependent oxidoreductase (luciferase family)
MKYETIVMPKLYRPRWARPSNTLGPPVCLNQHHPAHVAARLAFLDHLSKGRLNLAFESQRHGRSRALRLDPKDGGSRMDEAIEIILKL